MVVIYLVERGYLRGLKKVYSNPVTATTAVGGGGNSLEEDKQQTLMDMIIRTVSSCADQFDDRVHLQVYYTNI